MEDDKLILTHGKLNGERWSSFCLKFSQHGSWTDSMGLYKTGGEAGSDSTTWLQMMRLSRQHRLSGKIISRVQLQQISAEL